MKKVLIILFTMASAGVYSQQLLKPETLWKFGRISEPKVSPDGKQVLFGVTEYSIEANKGNTDLYLMKISGGKDPLRLTNTPFSENGARWRPDGKKIGFLSSESGSMQLWEINPDGTGKIQVTNVEGGIANFNYAPSGDRIYFTAEVKMFSTVADKYPDLPLANGRVIDGLMYRHWNQWSDEYCSHLFGAGYKDGKLTSDPVDLTPGEEWDTPTGPFGGEEQLSWSPTGKMIAYSSKKLKGTEFATSTNSDIYVLDLNTVQTINVSLGNEGYDNEPVFSPLGRYIAWLSMKTPGFEADKNRIILYDRIANVKKDLTAGVDQSAGNLRWSRDGQYLYFESPVQGTHQIFEVDINTGKIRQITTGIHDLTAFEVAGNELIAVRTTMSNPAELWKVDIKSGKMEQFTFVNQSLLSTLKLGQVRKRMVKTTDGKDMLTWVIYPPDFDSTKKYPTILYCQGGPQSMVSQFFSYRWNFQLMAAQGYIVVAPNRRGLPGFGQAWNDEISGDWGGQAMKDLLSAIDDVSKESYVDKDRRGAIGASFGGYSVYWLAGNHHGRFKSFIAHCGVFNLTGMYGHTEEIFFSNHDMGGPYWKEPVPRSYTEFSPHLFVKNWDTPILVIHNERDFRVPLSEGMQAFTAAQLKGIKSRFLYFSDEGHWVTRPQNSLLWQREFFAWLKETL